MCRIWHAGDVFAIPAHKTLRQRQGRCLSRCSLQADRLSSSSLFAQILLSRAFSALLLCNVLQRFAKRAIQHVTQIQHTELQTLGARHISVLYTLLLVLLLLSYFTYFAELIT